jgi:hypothetical protein
MPAITMASIRAGVDARKFQDQLNRKSIKKA